MRGVAGSVALTDAATAVEGQAGVQRLGRSERTTGHQLFELRKHGPSTPIRLAEQLRLNRTLVRRNLLALKQLGIIDIDPARSETDVRKRHFFINDTALAAILDTVQTLAADSGGRES
ncbi:hypothetical protein [Rathayibacter iranicus]|uniref:Uncharacterized protein n=2 Tax=Rathayibacter iranicus TaxID=59737 RepID=A0AAD1ADR8_9MICO|nr:hypothetical protein [Rathayibacter iranicus]AZZ56387.1 hypothetical protein C7V51_11245 [Rathayibacter iranicus]MWV31758.1 hypothetical protein [Rathayibacter iranicus NCPPB 2253 = VKM Ac-1602]PPI44947.1 hypothetical protein C5E09_10165 [Rathayibacter iranicus]PPI59245.1 hypothetical protein C5E08_11100 [Rathayibacter iranicus]PPI70398.1 hypothetical protein C5E01_10140 [Rathayibacter iranicus]